MMLCGTCVAPGHFKLIPATVPQSAPEGWAQVDAAAGCKAVRGQLTKAIVTMQGAA